MKLNQEVSLAQSEIEVLNQRIVVFEQEISQFYQEEKNSKALKNSENIKIMTDSELRNYLESEKALLDEQQQQFEANKKQLLERVQFSEDRVINLERIIIREKNSNKQLKEQNAELVNIKKINEQLIAKSTVLENELISRQERRKNRSRSKSRSKKRKQQPTNVEPSENDLLNSQAQTQNKPGHNLSSLNPMNYALNAMNNPMQMQLSPQSNQHPYPLPVHPEYSNANTNPNTNTKQSNLFPLSTSNEDRTSSSQFYSSQHSYTPNPHNPQMNRQTLQSRQSSFKPHRTAQFGSFGIPKGNQGYSMGGVVRGFDSQNHFYKSTQNQQKIETIDENEENNQKYNEEVYNRMAERLLRADRSGLSMKKKCSQIEKEFKKLSKNAKQLKLQVEKSKSRSRSKSKGRRRGKSHKSKQGTIRVKTSSSELVNKLRLENLKLKSQILANEKLHLSQIVSLGNTVKKFP